MATKCPIMPDDQFNRIADLSAEERANLPPDMVERFLEAGRWHNRQRMSEPLFDGMIFGGKTGDEFDASLKDQDSSSS